MNKCTLESLVLKHSEEISELKSTSGRCGMKKTNHAALGRKTLTLKNKKPRSVKTEANTSVAIPGATLNAKSKRFRDEY